MIDISIQSIAKAFEEGNNILDGISFDDLFAKWETLATQV